jgi:L-threonate 2-dehydrogenase
MKVAIVGLGIMGSAYAANLLAGGAEVSGSDPLDGARDALTQAGGTAYGDIGPWVAEADLVITSLLDPGILKMVVGQLATHLGAGQIIADTGTFHLADKLAARDIAEQGGAVMLDCPVSGTGAQARTKDLLMMASGPEDVVDRIRPILDLFTKGVLFAGEFGMGSRLKFTANHAVVLHNCAAAETLHYARAQGLEDDIVYQMLSTGAGQSRMSTLRMPLMIAGDYRPPTASLKMFDKDVQVISTDISEVACATPIFDVCRELYKSAYGSLDPDLDSAAVYEVYKAGNADALPQ